MDLEMEMEVQENKTSEETEVQENKTSEETEVQENNPIEGNNATPPIEAKQEIPFKKPTILIGKIGRLPKKVLASTSTSPSVSKQETGSEEKPAEETVDALQNEAATSSDVKSLNADSPEDQSAKQQLDSKQAPPQQLPGSSISFPYKEPSWSGQPETTGKPYAFEVLKNGIIIQTIDLMKKPFLVFGRLLNCDISAQHPTISRYHAVIQYRDIPSETEPPGFYVYDLGSTHGTFLNGKNNKLKPKIYAPIRVGHILRLGLSQRSYILTGPEDDQEEESELSVTELKQLREQKIQEHKEKMKQAELEREEKRKKEENRGVDWGMGDDADDDDDDEVGENPYASTNNEELYLDDPKKALRGFFEREGVELDYVCTEQGMGQFLCKVELPVDDEMGRPIVAEVLHRGKKKDAVVQCALEACRVLDRFGVLRQATHESKKRKAKNWEENDFYDSDDDTFLDRTGTIEKKRAKRMQVVEPEKVETYESLLEKEREISSSITKIEQRLYLAQEKQAGASSSTQSEEDSLDSYMNTLGKDKLDKQTISKLKLELADLKKSHANVIKLSQIAKPANLPNLAPSTSASTSGMPKRALPLFGKRRIVPVKFPVKPSESTITQTSNEDDEEESEEEMEEAKDTLGAKESSTSRADEPGEDNEHFNETNIATSSSCKNVAKEEILAKETLGNIESSSSHVDEPGKDNGLEHFNETSMASSSSSNNVSKEEILPSETDASPNETVSSLSVNSENDENVAMFAAAAEKHMQKTVKILQKLDKYNRTELRLDFHWETVKAKKVKILKLLEQLTVHQSAQLKARVSTELYRLSIDLGEMFNENGNVYYKIANMTGDCKTILSDLNSDIDSLTDCYDQLMEGFNSKKKIYNEREQINNEDLRKNSIEQSQEMNKKKLKKDEEIIDKEPQKKSEHSQEINSEENSEETDEKKRKKNQKRNEQRQYKAEMEKLKGYEEDASKEDYNMWVPPIDQSGDGRTDLNDKFGY